MAENVFTLKETMPDEKQVKEKLGSNYLHLEDIRQFIEKEIGETTEEWKFYGRKIGWNMKKLFKKRNLFFITIHSGYFMISFVFGDKAVNSVLDSCIDAVFKKELAGARKYAEGRGISIRIDDARYLDDIKELIRIKIKH